MKIAIRKELDGLIYIDKNLRDDIPYTEPPYNFTLIDVDVEDCLPSDFNDDLTFNLEKYNARKQKIKDIIKLNELTQKLFTTDYIANKLAEAVSKYISTGDNTDVLLLREKYALELINREEWRNEVDKLQQKLKLLDK